MLIGFAVSMGAILIATLGVRAVLRQLSSAFTELDRIAKTSAKLQIATEDLIALEFGAKRAGVSVEQMGKGVQRMQKSISDASVGLSTAKRGFDQLGLSWQNLQKMSSAEQFATISGAMESVTIQTDKMRIAMDLFGRSGGDMLNMMHGGADAVEEWRRRTERLGISFSSLDLKKVEMANDAWTDAKDAIGGAFQQIAIAFAPMVERVSTALANLVGSVDWEGWTNGIMRALVGAGQMIVQWGSRVAQAMSTLVADMARDLAWFAKQAANVADWLPGNPGKRELGGIARGLDAFARGAEGIKKAAIRLDGAMDNNLWDQWEAAASNAAGKLLGQTIPAFDMAGDEMGEKIKRAVSGPKADRLGTAGFVSQMIAATKANNSKTDQLLTKQNEYTQITNIELGKVFLSIEQMKANLTPQPAGFGA